MPISKKEYTPSADKPQAIHDMLVELTPVQAAAFARLHDVRRDPSFTSKNMHAALVDTMVAVLDFPCSDLLKRKIVKNALTKMPYPLEATHG